LVKLAALRASAASANLRVENRLAAGPVLDVQGALG
jgi:hypothetical protein